MPIGRRLIKERCLRRLWRWLTRESLMDEACAKSSKALHG
jgi:hypothetical protein